MRDKVKKALPYIIVNLIGAVLAVLSCFNGVIAVIVVFTVVIPSAYIIPLPVSLLIFITLNIAAFVAVKKDKNAAGLTLAILCGSLGALVGTLFNRDYKYAKAVRIIFNAHIWICVSEFCSVDYVGSHF
ncbi:MAG: hypothetical protein K2J76_04460 [Oscillospiraceae bacterium]|nr:hypothetical protein [Oscillospiraceae bacterium]